MTEKTFKFTKVKIESLPPAPKGGRTEYRDSEVSGLLVRVTAGGVKTFSVSRKKHGEHFRVTLGRFPDLSVESARTQAIKALNDIARTQQNPNELRRQNEKKAVTLIEAFEERLRVREHKIKENTITRYRSLLDNYCRDWFNLPLKNITRSMVEKRHKDITEGVAWFGNDKSTYRAGVGAGSRAQADGWARVLRSVFRFAWDHYRDAEGHSLLPEPPTMVLSTKSLWHGLERKSERVRNSDLGRWLSAIELVRKKAEEERDDFAQSVCDSVFLAMFTGLRKSEILNLTWDRVNLGGRYFWISKTKNGDPLELPVTKTLLNLFRRRLALREENESLVFPGQSGGIISEPRRVISNIVAATIPDPNPDDLPQVNFKFHDARRTYGSAAALAGLDGYIIKRLMNHRTARSADVTQGYLHFGADELQESAEKVERFILEKAGLVESRKGLDSQIHAALESLSDEGKRKLLFSVLNSQSDLAVKNE
ncbi:site-specific integrase [Salmonella enterica]|nr:site-specific integrase [Salmonella enterica]